MNTTTRYRSHTAPALTAAAIASLLLASCATAPMSPQGSADVRTKLTRLQSDPNLADRAPVAIKEAELAVRAAEQPLADDAEDMALGAHRVYIADRKVEIAIAEASTRYAEDQRAKLGEERERARLAARTREADMAKQHAEVARTDADAARRDAEELQRQIDALHAEATDRGLVLTLGDVLFTSGRADLKVGAASNLNRLVEFLTKYPDRNIMIVGHTDSQGSDEYNLDLSQRRADSVQAYLMQQGVSSNRIAASAMGEQQPIASNETEVGRMQNRRVEVIIDNPPRATASATM
jgi:outer membrane protein OmpA-like peptidoglycan-associated protein